MTSNQPREIVRHLQDGDPERDFPCFAGQGGHVEACERPATMAVYGLSFCEVHGAECADGALEEMHQHADEFFTRFDNASVPELDNPLVLRAVRGWEMTLREEDHFLPEHTEDLLLAAFPFREDKVAPESAEEIAEPICGQDPPYDDWRYHRYEMHQLMRHAYRLGMTHVVENLEEDREWVASQCAYALALSRGEHPEVLQRARREIEESNRKVAEHFAK